MSMYTICSRCKRKIPWREARVTVQFRRGDECLDTENLHQACSEFGETGHARKNRRHAEIVEQLETQGPMGVARALGSSRKSVYYHRTGRCQCGLPNRYAKRGLRC